MMSINVTLNDLSLEGQKAFIAAVQWMNRSKNLEVPEVPQGILDEFQQLDRENIEKLYYLLLRLDTTRALHQASLLFKLSSLPGFYVSEAQMIDTLAHLWATETRKKTVCEKFRDLFWKPAELDSLFAWNMLCILRRFAPQQT